MNSCHGNNSMITNYRGVERLRVLSGPLYCRPAPVGGRNFDVGAICVGLSLESTLVPPDGIDV